MPVTPFVVSGENMAPRSSSTVRGGWSTSICDLFADPSNRSNCCALACCGLLLHDKNAHLLLPHSRRSGWNRLGVYLGIPIVVVGALLTGKSYAIDDNSPDEEIAVWDMSILGTFAILVLVLSLLARNERIQLRQAVLAKLNHYQQRGQGSTRTNNDDDDEDADAVMGGTVPPNQTIARTVGNLTVDAYLQLQSSDTHAAHTFCCFTNDRGSQYPQALAGGENLEGSNRVMSTTTEGGQGLPRDFCSVLFECLSRICCGAICNCFCQCCGVCALGQEHRELQLLLEDDHSELLQTDYITHQPYADYFPLIQQLRSDQSHSPYQHCCYATSRLSKQLVRILGIAIVLATIVAVTPYIDPDFGIQNLVVMLATLMEGLLVVMLVWCGYKFDLSFDAVVKYFASGFCLCTFLALVYEMVVGGLVGFVSTLVVAFGIASEIDPDMDQREVEKLGKRYAKDHIVLFSIFVFINAFIVAALIEELVKYFGYHMVETPDIMEQNVAATRNETDEEGEDREATTSLSVAGPPRSLVSRGAAITIGMVAVAAGFACAENLVYVFFYSPPGIDQEVGTLLVRSLFPVHPLCAAIQSIGVVQRDIEKHKGYGIGRILLPAVLLHGLFDFVLMLVGLIENAQKPDDDDDDVAQNDDEPPGPLEVASLAITASLVVLAILYYAGVARNQRKRLQGMDQQRGQADTGRAPPSSAPLV